MILRRSTLAIRDKLGYVVVMTDDSLSGHLGVRDIVWPEFMPWVGGGAVEDLSCRASRLAFAEEQSREAAKDRIHDVG
jgi:hypothetical protein